MSADLAGLVQKVLDERGLSYESPRPGAFLVALPGEHKLVTNCWLALGRHSLLVEAFVVRRPDENHAEFYRFLLERNTRAYVVAFAVDHLGDVYLVGRLPISAVCEEQLDLVLGSVLTYADETFDRALEIGFATSICREWAWRRARGESVANLAAFAHLAPPEE